MNFLVLLVDDIGKELYGDTAPGGGNLAGAGSYALPSLPTFDSLMADGCYFERFYVQQLCSPTRAGLLTGRYPERHGVTDILRDDDDIASTQSPLPESEYTLAKCLKAVGYDTACFGKWHLANVNNGGRDHPRRAGFDTYSGNRYNLSNANFHEVEGTRYREGFYAWPCTIGGVEDRTVRTFHTSHIANNAIRWIRARNGRPFFCYVPFFGAHAPFINNSAVTSGTPAAVNVPPTSLYDAATWTRAQDSSGSPADSEVLMHAYRSHVEAIDTEMARIIAACPADTTIIFASDNGSSVSTLALEEHPTLGAYPGRGKDTPYETGIWSPLVIKGPDVTAGRYTKLANVVDLFPTVLELAGCDLPDTTIDGVSLVPALEGAGGPLRSFSYSQWAQPTGVGVDRTTLEWAIIGDADGSGSGRYKLIQPSISDAREFYDLGASYDGLMESTNLTPSGDASGLSAPQLAAHAALTEEYEALVDSWTD